LARTVAHIVAAIVLVICYFTGFMFALNTGAGNHDLFGWATLFGIAFAVPSLIFVLLALLLFSFFGWPVTALLFLSAIGGWAFKPHGVGSEGWNMVLAVVIAAVAHQLTLLLLCASTDRLHRVSSPSRRPPSAG
jgi:hypothetical protein